MLARIANLLGDADVSIVAMNCATFGVHGGIQIVVDHVEKARQALDHQRLPYTEQGVLFLELPDAPGGIRGEIGRPEDQCDLRVCHRRNWM